MFTKDHRKHFLRFPGSRSQTFSEGNSRKIKRKTKTFGINYKSIFWVWRVTTEISRCWARCFFRGWSQGATDPVDFLFKCPWRLNGHQCQPWSSPGAEHGEAGEGGRAEGGFPGIIEAHERLWVSSQGPGLPRLKSRDYGTGELSYFCST